VSAAHPSPSCGCPSVLFHLITCPGTHPELAALPTEMPHNVEVAVAHGPDGHLVVPTITTFDGTSGALLTPRLARGLARMLLLKADEAERNNAETALAA
jgi:hypothetical protein